MRVLKSFTVIFPALLLLLSGALSAASSQEDVEKTYGKRLKVNAERGGIKSLVFQSRDSESIYHFKFESPATGVLEQNLYGVRSIRHSNSGIFLVVDLYQDDKKPISKIYVMGREVVTMPGQVSAGSIYDDAVGVVVATNQGALAFTVDQYGNVSQYDLQLLPEIDLPTLKFTPDMQWVYTSYDPTADDIIPPDTFYYRKLSKANSDPMPWDSYKFDGAKITSAAFESDEFHGIVVDGSIILWDGGKIKRVNSPSGIRYNYLYRSENPSYYIATNLYQSSWCVLSEELVELGCIGKKKSKAEKYYGNVFSDDIADIWMSGVNIDGDYLQLKRQDVYPYKHRKKLKLSSIIKKSSE